MIPFFFFLTGCGNTFRVYNDIDTAANFNQYSTYSFLDWTDGNKKVITEMELERIRNTFAKELESKGLTYSADSSDVKVKITVYFREARYPYYGWYPSTYNYIERAFVLDIFESKTNKQIWHSVGVGEAGRTPEIRAEQLPRQAEKMFDAYPI